MRRRTRTSGGARAIATAIAIAAVALAASCGARPVMPASAPHVLVGKAMPSLEGRHTVDGASLDTRALGGRAVVVKFFAEYCAPCKVTLPAAERVHEAYPDVAFVGVAEDESRETATRLVSRYGLTFPVVFDGANVLSGRFRVGELPATFVADRTGTIRWVGDERQSEDELKQAVEAAR